MSFIIIFTIILLFSGFSQSEFSFRFEFMVEEWRNIRVYDEYRHEKLLKKYCKMNGNIQAEIWDVKFEIYMAN